MFERIKLYFIKKKINKIFKEKVSILRKNMIETVDNLLRYYISTEIDFEYYIKPNIIYDFKISKDGFKTNYYIFTLNSNMKKLTNIVDFIGTINSNDEIIIITNHDEYHNVFNKYNIIEIDSLKKINLNLKSVRHIRDKDYLYHELIKILEK